MRKISGICALFAILLAALPAKAENIVLHEGDNTLSTTSGYTATFTTTVAGTVTIEIQDMWPSVWYKDNQVGQAYGTTGIKYTYIYVVDVEAGETIVIKDDWPESNPGCYIIFTPAGGPDPTPEPWTFASVSPAEGEVESLAAPITLSFPEGMGGFDEDCVYGIEGGAIIGTLTTPSGSEDLTFNHDFNVTGVQIYSFSDFTAEKTEPGTYTLTFAEGIATAVKTGAKNAAMTYTWTIPTPEPPAGDETECEFGEVTVTTTDNTKFVISFDDLNNVDYGEGTPTFDGTPITFGIDFNLPYNCATFTLSSAASAGKHTIIIPAGCLLDDFDGEPNVNDIKIVFTIGGTTPGGNGTSEVFFEAGDLDGIVASYGNVEGISGEGVDMTTESFYNTMMAETLWPSYNINSEKELNWKNGTKLIFTSKTNVITSIVFTPTSSSTGSLPYATADKGDYTNGVWTGSLAAGETVTLTANDGINIAKITINYNGGAAGGDDDDDDVEPSIEILSPEDGSTIASLAYSSSAATPFVTIKTNIDYAEIDIRIINEKDGVVITREYDFPGEEMVPASESTTIGITPEGEKTYYFIKGETYKIKVLAYLHKWDVPNGEVAAAAADSICFTGNGKDREKLSAIELVSIDPTPRTSVDGIDAVPDTLSCTADATINVEFNGAVSTLNAVIPGGMSGTNTNLTTAKADATGTKWTITIPADQMTGVEAYPYDFTFNITAKDASGLYLDLDPSHSDHTLDITFSITNTSSEEPGGDDDPSGDDPSGDDDDEEIVGQATTTCGDVTITTADNKTFHVTFAAGYGLMNGKATIDGTACETSQTGADAFITVVAEETIAAGDHEMTFPAYSLMDLSINMNSSAVTIPFTIAGGSSEDPDDDDDDEPADGAIITLYENGDIADGSEVTSITKNGVTFTFGYNSQYAIPIIKLSNGGILTGKNNTFTFTCSKNIVSIDFTGTAKNLTTAATSLDHYDWTGCAKEYSFKPSETTVYISKIVVTIEGAEETTVPFTMTSAGWGTLILPFEAEIPTGLTAYSTSNYNDSDILTLSEATSLEANTPYIMAGTAGSYEFKGVATNTESSYTNGLLTGVFADTGISSGYVMQMQGDDVAFFLVNTTVTVPAYHCYISAKSSSTIFRFGDVTAIENALQTISSEPIYDLSGRQVEGALKQGIYIQGGKKFFVK